MTSATPALPQTITQTVDDADGNRIDDAILTVRQIIRLTCGCHRFECNRPGGGTVHVLRGKHCEDLARPSPAAPPESIPA